MTQHNRVRGSAAMNRIRRSRMSRSSSIQERLCGGQACCNRPAEHAHRVRRCRLQHAAERKRGTRQSSLVATKARLFM
jgi:hypothetical protein